MRRLTVDLSLRQEDALAAAAAAAVAGAVVAIPTDTLYGLAVNPFDDLAVEATFRVKGRAGDQPLPLIAGSREQVAELLGALGPAGERLAEHYWPGPLTLLIAAPARLAAGVLAGHDTVGVRVPAHPVARALCLAAAMPLTATSANRSGALPTNDPDVVAATLPEIDVLVDSGLTPGGPPSTIVSVAGARPVLVRQGAIAWEEILQCLDRDRG